MGTAMTTALTGKAVGPAVEGVLETVEKINYNEIMRFIWCVY